MEQTNKKQGESKRIPLNVNQSVMLAINDDTVEETSGK